MNWLNKPRLKMYTPRPKLRRLSLRHPILTAVWTLAALLGCRMVQAAYEAPNAAYNAPTHYYDTAAGTGITLQTNLHNDHQCQLHRPNLRRLPLFCRNFGSRSKQSE